MEEKDLDINEATESTVESVKKVYDDKMLSKFSLAKICYQEGNYEQALEKFEEIKETDIQALYQIATMNYDGIGCSKNEKKGFELMMKVATSNDKQTSHLRYSAQYNIGQAYFEGYGVKQSDKEAERWWLLAADDGDPKASIKAQTMLGMFYSRPDFLNLNKSFFWHSEACGNGSLESQGILGVMYMFGEGIRKDIQSALECLKEASTRGNVYAQGRLIQLFYEKKLFTKACDLAKKVVAYEDIDLIAQKTGCMESYIKKGIALACFYLSRCLYLGKGLKKDAEKSNEYLGKLCELDPSLAYDLHLEVTYGFA